MKEKCVICGDETRYDDFDHIDHRNFYVEGAGQLCPTCHNATYEEKIFAPIPSSYLKHKILAILNDIHSERSQINFDSPSVRDSIASQIAAALEKNNRQLIT
jgi:hypothetical protein